MASRGLILCVVLALGGCSLFQERKVPLPPAVTSDNALVEVPWTLLPHDCTAARGFGSIESLRTAIEYSLEYYRRLPAEQRIHFGPHHVSVARQTEFLKRLYEILGSAHDVSTLDAFLREHTRLMKSTARSVRFTGYYEAELRGSRTRSEQFHVPLYRVPSDLVRIQLDQFVDRDTRGKLPAVLRGRITPENTVVPYFTREQIDFEGALAGRALELVWLEDPLETFFLHIQGSGVVTLDTGEVTRMGYADANGHPYRAIGGELLRRGLLRREEISMQSIVAYLRAHPQITREILSSNPSYVFYREVERGPLGNIEVPLTPYRSIATDAALFPKGALAWVQVGLPSYEERPERAEVDNSETFSCLVMNQDTGGAIKGPGRVDLFTGRGANAEWRAGHLNAEGTLYFLLPRDPSV